MASKKTKQEPEKTKVTETVKLYKGQKKEEREPLKVWLNGVGYSVPRGKEIEVPVGVADIIRNAEAERMAAADYLAEE